MHYFVQAKVANAAIDAIKSLDSNREYGYGVAYETKCESTLEYGIQPFMTILFFGQIQCLAQAMTGYFTTKR